MSDRTLARLRAELHAPRKPIKVIHRKPVEEVPKAAAEPKPVREAPKGQGGEIWQKYYNQAVAQGHPEPAKLADTLLRAREKAQELDAAKHKLKVTDKKPTVAECSGLAPSAKKAVTSGALCKAVTLENRPCKFRAVCGGFCKKHSGGN
jgi:hypothetical protein